MFSSFSPAPHSPAELPVGGVSAGLHQGGIPAARLHYLHFSMGRKEIDHNILWFCVECLTVVLETLMVHLRKN